MSPPKKNNTISRGAEILKALSEGYGRLEDIYPKVGLSKSTAHRILQTLVASGFAFQNPLNRNYHIGPLILKLSAIPTVSHQMLILSSIDELKKLSDSSGETCLLSIPNGSQRMVLKEVRSSQKIALSLGEGEFLVLFGPNGAGKSSLLGMLAGALRPTSGTVSIRGVPLDFSEVEWRGRIGLLSHRGFLYAHLTAEENLRFYGSLFGLTDLDERIPERLARVGLSDRARFEVRQLSHGMRQRLSLARALLHDPDVVLLDEPYTGLDPSAAAVLRDVLRGLRDGRRTVVMVTHNLTEGLQLATRVAIQVAGRMAWEGPISAVELDGFETFYHQVVEGRA